MDASSTTPVATTHGWAGYGRPGGRRFCGRCTCGWESAPSSTAGMAMAAFDRHSAKPLLEGGFFAPVDGTEVAVGWPGRPTDVGVSPAPRGDGRRSES